MQVDFVMKKSKAFLHARTKVRTDLMKYRSNKPTLRSNVKQFSTVI